MASQHCPTNNHHHSQPHQASTSTSTSHHENNSLSLSSSSSSSLTSSTIPTSPPFLAPIHAGHYSMLFHNNFHQLQQDIMSHGQGFNLNHLLLNDNSTMLHLAASYSQLNFIDSILQQCPQLLCHQNSNHDLPIHVAAKSCQFESVEKLVSWARNVRDDTMLEMVNREGNTALHIALENHHKEMADVLFMNCPKTFCFVNEQGFSPLYLAIKAEFWDLAQAMVSFTGYDEAEAKLLEGRSVVHAAIIAKKKDIFEMMINEYNNLLHKKTDEMGRRPLSYAAYTGFLEGVNYILNNFPNETYKIDEDEYGSFPIHSAGKGGDIKVVKAFFSSLPIETRFLRNKMGQHILHVAAASGKTKIVKFILGHPELEMMINMKDEDGNAPLHLGAMGKHARVVYVLTWDERVKLGVQNKKGCTALDIAEDYEDQVPSFEERLTWLSLRYAGVPRAPKLQYFNLDIIDPPNNLTHHVNNHTLQSNPIDLEFEEGSMHTVLPRTLDTQVINNPNNSPTTFLDHKAVLLNLIKDHPKTKRKNKYKERINALLVVATLVATVTFASGFAVPGGYNQNKPHIGLATLAHKAFFQVFIISDTIAMYSAILSLVTLIWAHLDDPRLVLVSLDFALPLLGVALAMMSVAFTAALYVVLHNMVFWLGVMVLTMGGVFLVAFLVFFIPLYSPTSCIRNKILRYVFHIPFTLMLLACEKGKRR